MVRRGRMDKGGREQDRVGLPIREPGQGLLWCAGMFGFSEAFHGEVAQQVPDEAGRVGTGGIDEDRVYGLLEQLLGVVDVGSDEDGTADPG